MWEKNKKESYVKMIVNIDEHIPHFSRYNGGWIKTVERIDKDYQNGYSLVGDFLPVSSGNIKLDEDTLYLDCSIDGSRKHQDKSYTLFKLIDGDVFVLKELLNAGQDWALSLWDTIESELGVIEETRVDELHSRIRKLSEEDYNMLVEKLLSDKRFRDALDIFF